MGKGITRRIKGETNPTAYNRKRRLLLGCPHCPPHRHENSKRKPKYGNKKGK